MIWPEKAWNSICICSKLINRLWIKGANNASKSVSESPSKPLKFQLPLWSSTNTIERSLMVSSRQTIFKCRRVRNKSSSARTSVKAIDGLCVSSFSIKVAISIIGTNRGHSPANGPSSTCRPISSTKKFSISPRRSSTCATVCLPIRTRIIIPITSDTVPTRKMRPAIAMIVSNLAVIF